MNGELTNALHCRTFLDAGKPLRLAGTFWWSKGDSNCEPLYDALVNSRNCERFCRPGNRVGLPGPHGGAEWTQTSGLRRYKNPRALTALCFASK